MDNEKMKKATKRLRLMVLDYESARDIPGSGFTITGPENLTACKEILSLLDEPEAGEMVDGYYPCRRCGSYNLSHTQFANVNVQCLECDNSEPFEGWQKRTPSPDAPRPEAGEDWQKYAPKAHKDCDHEGGCDCPFECDRCGIICADETGHSDGCPDGTAAPDRVKALVFGKDYFVSLKHLDQLNEACGSDSFEVDGDRFTLGDIIHTATAALKAVQGEG